MTPYKELRYYSGYEIDGDVVDVRYILTDAGMRYCVDSPARQLVKEYLPERYFVVDAVTLCHQRLTDKGRIFAVET